MAETKPTETRKLGKRGIYSGEHKLNFTKTEDGKAWEIKVKKEPKSKVDEERTRLNSIKNENRKVLLDELDLQNYDRKTAVRIANYEIEGEYKKKKGQQPPQHYHFKNQDKLNQAREAYNKRKRLDSQSAEQRRGKDNSDRKIYDLIRGARLHHKDSIYLQGQELKLKDITQVSDTGQRIPANQVPFLDKTFTKNVKTKQKDIDGKPIIKIVKKHIKGKDGKSIVSYQIGGDKLIAIGNTAQVSASNIKRPTILVEKRKVKKRKVGNRIVFTRVGNQLITRSKVDLLFNKARAKHGLEAPIYLNNKPFELTDFIKVKGGWALTGQAQAELNATEYEGVASVRYSQVYRRELVSLEARTGLGKPERAEKALYGEIKTSISLPGGTVENVTILIRSLDALQAIRRMSAANKKSGTALFCVVATDFTASKKGNDGVIELGATLREGNALFIEKNLVMDSDDNLVGKYKALDHYLVISFIDGFFVIQVKSLQMVYGGLTSDTGEIVHR